MGLMDFIKSQLIDIIEWLDDSNNTLVYRFPDQDHEIKNGAKLTVREGQAAIFVNEGQIADVFPPGLYSLTTQNLPILSRLKGWKYGFESPFKAEVYFVNTRRYMDMKWGTPNPIMLRDAEFGVVRLRAFGIYAIRVKDPATFLREVVGTDGHYTTRKIEGQLRRTLVSSFTTHVAKAKVPAIDLAAHYDTIGARSMNNLQGEFEPLGIELVSFVIENISLPPALEEVLDKRASMGILGDVNRYTQFQAADALRDAANQPGGIAGMGVALGAGLTVGQTFGNAMAPSAGGAVPQPPGAAAPPPPPGGQSFHYAANGQNQGQLSVNQIAAQIRNAPAGTQHYIFSGGQWVKPQDVPAVAALLNPKYRYAVNGTDKGEVAMDQIVASVCEQPGGSHYIFSGGQWVKPQDIPELGAAINAELSKRVPPPPGGGSVPPPPQ